MMPVGEKLKQLLGLDRGDEIRFSDLSSEYQNRIIEELAERMKDIVYTNAEKNAREALTEMIDPELDQDTDIEITYSIHLLGSDIKQILGRMERKKDRRSSTNYMEENTTDEDKIPSAAPGIIGPPP